MKRIFGVLFATFTLTSLVYSQSFFFADDQLEFDVEVENNAVKISIKTGEDDHHIYALERSNNGETFENMSLVQAEQSAVGYAYVDSAASIGKSFYRLVQKDTNGDEVIDIVPVYNTSLNNQPLKAEYKFEDGLPQIILDSGAKSSELLQLKIYSASGDLIEEAEVNGGEYQYNLNSRLSNGLYTISVYAYNIEKSSKLLVY